MRRLLRHIRPDMTHPHARYRDAVIASRLCRLKVRRRRGTWQVLSALGWKPCPPVSRDRDALRYAIESLGDGSRLMVTESAARIRARFGSHRAAEARTEAAAICLAAIRARHR